MRCELRMWAWCGETDCSSFHLKKKKGRLASGDPSSTYSSPTLNGRLLDFRTRGLSPGRIQLGNLCSSISARAGYRTEVMDKPSLQVQRE